MRCVHIVHFFHYPTGTNGYIGVQYHFTEVVVHGGIGFKLLIVMVFEPIKSPYFVRTVVSAQ